MLSSLGYLGVMFLLFFVSRSNLISFYSALIRLIFLFANPNGHLKVNSGQLGIPNLNSHLNLGWGLEHEKRRLFVVQWC